MFMCIRYSLHSVRFGQLLGCAHQRVVNIMKVYIETKNMQVQFRPFLKKISTLLTLETLKWESFASNVFTKMVP